MIFFLDSVYLNLVDLKMEQHQFDLVKNKIKKNSKSNLKLLKENLLKYNNFIKKWQILKIIYILNSIQITYPNKNLNKFSQNMVK